MWGDPERAIGLEPSDVLCTVLFQITGPAHVPWQDARWQELLHGYNVWVHVEVNNSSSVDCNDEEDAEEEDRNNNSSSRKNLDCLGRACQSMVRYAPNTSNLAALCLHTTRMLHEVLTGPSNVVANNNSNDDNGTTAVTGGVGGGAVEAFSNRIAMVGRARALCGALNLLRIFSHAVILQDAAAAAAAANVAAAAAAAAAATSKRKQQKEKEEDVNSTSSSTIVTESYSYLSQVFLYRSRDSGREMEAGSDLLSALLHFCSLLCVMTGTSSSSSSSSASTSTSTPSGLQQQQQQQQQQQHILLSSVPELYDAAVLSVQLLLVLYSTQLYNPMLSSVQRGLQQSSSSSVLFSQHQQQYFASQLFALARQHQQQENSSSNDGTTSSSSSWTPQSVVWACLEWQLQRPRAPPKSIAQYNAELAKSVARAKGGGGGGASIGIAGVGANKADASSSALGPDGMYETYQIVLACAPQQLGSNSGTINANSSSLNQLDNSSSSGMHHLSGGGRLILDATKGVLVLSSNIILLPFRLMSLALGLWGHHGASKEKGYDQAHKKHYQSTLQGNDNGAGSTRRRRRRQVLTKDVLWLSDSPLADLASCLLLLLTNNERASPSNDSHNKSKERDNHDGEKAEADDDRSSSCNTANPFRAQLWALTDTRWWEADGNYNGNHNSDFPDLPDLTATTGEVQGNLETIPLMSSPPTPEVVGANNTTPPPANVLTINFERLFESFGRIAHTEVGALLLYTLLQSSPSFADAMAVRSDLDTLILPLLRTLYFASAARHYSAQDYNSYYSRSSAASESSSSTTSTAVLSIRNCPFRSSSQLYVIIILLLLFSQDSSFGPDAFRRVMIPAVPFYKERNLKDISLGSILILSLLRNLTFNLNRLQDAFLLSNCCAILMNLSSTIVNLHDYAAMRLASVTISTMKRYATLRQENAAAGIEVAGEADDEDDLSSPTAMHGEVARTLLRVLKHCLGPRSIEGNLHLVYALVYHQADFKKAVGGPPSAASAASASPSAPPLFKKSEISRVQKVIQAATSIIEQADTRTATRALKVLSENAEKMKQAVADSHRAKRSSDVEDFTFTYEEEVDPEIFFVPYVWEVIVCAVTASSIEWKKSAIQVFPLLQMEEEEEEASGGQSINGDADSPEAVAKGFATDVSDVV